MKIMAQSFLVVMCGFVGALLSGCGGNDVGRYQVTGTVTYEGNPVPAGEVIFEPDGKKGNRGPQSRAKIIEGQFSTPSAKGAVAGPVVVRIRCYDGDVSPVFPMGMPTRLPYTLEIDLPHADSEQEFVVPAQLQ